MKEQEFNELMKLNDELNEMNETYAGIENAVMDGDTYEDHGSSEKECEDKLAFVDFKRVELCSRLGVPMNFLLDILDSCVINRWEMYTYIKGLTHERK